MRNIKEFKELLPDLAKSINKVNGEKDFFRKCVAFMHRHNFEEDNRFFLVHKSEHAIIYFITDHKDNTDGIVIIETDGIGQVLATNIDDFKKYLNS